MSLNFACICPHPPLLIPEIGKEDTIKVSQTMLALKKLAHIFNEAEIDTLVFISPHGLVYPDRFNISLIKKSFGTFAQFNEPNITFEYTNDLELAEEIISETEKQEIEILGFENNQEFYELDHGIMVPLYYLRREQETSLKIIPIAYSWLDRAKHFSFGKAIAEAAQKSPERIGIVASGDLSHRLIQGSQAEIENGKKFDQQLIKDLKENKLEEICIYDEDLVENAGECGYRSIITLLGALDGIEAKPEVLSYEGPFGVGYLVANFRLPE